jgi:glycosyltransferase involved in cell wall biosynthesis
MIRLPPRLRERAEALRWRWLNRFDGLVMTPAIERAMLRRIGDTDAGSASPGKSILVDVSVIHNNDAGTGIQRVVRSLRQHLPAAVDGSTDIEFLIVPSQREGYVAMSGSALAGSPNAVFFGLDFATDSVFQFRRELREFKLAGGQLWFVVHDILPISYPQWFTHASRLKYRRWMRVIAALADGIMCVSPVVSEQVKGLLINRYGIEDLPKIVTVELGSDITPADRELAISDLPTAHGLDVSKFTNSALVVGTLEPRKGHADVLAAFELVWAAGHEIPLILIGRPGWNTEGLQQRIRQHPQKGQLLFWLEDVDDHALHAAYRHCRLAIVPSLAEGYGLPLDEALALGSPVLARNIPVFGRHLDARISYFAVHAVAPSIAEAIIVAHVGAQGPRRLAPLRQWEDTARQVADALGCANSVPDSITAGHFAAV